MDFILSHHAKNRLREPGRSQIQEEWIYRTLNDPDYFDEDPRTHCLRAWKRIPEFGNRALRVVYVPFTDPAKIVTVCFDRRYKNGF